MEGGDVGLGGGRWREEDEEFRVGGAKGGLRSKPRFTFSEVKALLQSVMKNRFIILRKFNQGVSSETKKQTWAEITAQINDLGENRREVRQIMKKWADLKCDGKRRIAAMRGPNGCHIRKKSLGPVERMVHKILMMIPQGDGDSDLEFDDDEDFPRNALKPAVATPAYSYLSLTESSRPLHGGVSFDISPLSSPEKDPGSEPYHSSPEFDDADYNMDFEDHDDSLFSPSVLPAPSVPPAASTSLDPLPDGALQRLKPVHTYSRNSQNQNSSSSSSSSKAAAPGPSSSSVASTSSALPTPLDAAAPPTSQSPPSFPPPLPPARDVASSSSSSSQQRPPSSAPPSDPLPTAAPSQRVAQMAAQSLQQQRASRMLLASVSQSLELLAQSVQLLVESQQEFVQESLLLQRETVDVLREFSGTALAMLRDKGAGQRATPHHHPAAHF